MKLLRRKFLRAAVGAVALSALPRGALALDYPLRAVRWIVGFAPGGGNDLVARLLGQWLQDKFGQPFVIENRPGATGSVAAEMVVRAAPDGYTLLLVSSNHATNAALDDKLSFDLTRDIAPVAAIGRNALLMAVSASVPVKTVPEFIAYAKANPGKINLASAGTGSIGHLSGELFEMMTETKLVHVPYRGNGPALAALLGGQVDVLFPSLASSREFAMSGKLRGLAVTSAARSDALPDLPTVAEFVPGFEASTWYGIGAPKATPPSVTGTLNAAISEALADAKIMARFSELGDVGTPMSAAAFGTFIAAETGKWAKVVKFANNKPE